MSAEAAQLPLPRSLRLELAGGRPQPGEDRKYVRFAYSGLPESDIREGLGILKQWIEA